MTIAELMMQEIRLSTDKIYQERTLIARAWKELFIRKPMYKPLHHGHMYTLLLSLY